MVNRKSLSAEIPIIRPLQLVKKAEVQPQAIVVFSPYDLQFFRSRLPVIKGSQQNLLFSSLQTFCFNDKKFTLAGPALGAPVAIMLLEVLIAYGASQIIAMGSCGSLCEKIRVGHIIVPESAFADEGTSKHYPLRGKPAKASPRIFQNLKNICQKQEQKWATGKVWSTDAPFRETPERIKTFQQKQAIAVEMELSAFFKVGNFYGVEVGAMLVVSDELFSLHWHPGYKNRSYKKAFSKAIEIAFLSLNQIE